jgi:arsenate reductase (glutaredoxin)
MSEKITVYEKPTCSTCRNLVKILKDAGIDFEKVDYYVAPLSTSEIAGLLKKMGISARELLRKTESTYKELDLAKADLKESEIIALMVKHPELMQRPIVEKGNRAVLGRPLDNVKEFLKID